MPTDRCPACGELLVEYQQMWVCAVCSERVIMRVVRGAHDQEWYVAGDVPTTRSGPYECAVDALIAAHAAAAYRACGAPDPC